MHYTSMAVHSLDVLICHSIQDLSRNNSHTVSANAAEVTDAHIIQTLNQSIPDQFDWIQFWRTRGKEENTNSEVIPKPIIQVIIAATIVNGGIVQYQEVPRMKPTRLERALDCDLEFERVVCAVMHRVKDWTGATVYTAETCDRVGVAKVWWGDQRRNQSCEWIGTIMAVEHVSAFQMLLVSELNSQRIDCRYVCKVLDCALAIFGTKLVYWDNVWALESGLVRKFIPKHTGYCALAHDSAGEYLELSLIAS